MYCKKKGLLNSACTFVDDIVAFNQKHLFNIHDSPIQNSLIKPEIKINLMYSKPK